MRSSLAVFLSGSMLSVVRLLAGLGRSKGVSALLGPEGIGLMAQATQFQLVAVSASSLSITTAMIQGARGPYRDRVEELFRAAILLIATGATTVLATCLIIGPFRLATWLFGPAHGSSDLALLLLSVPFILASSSFLEAAYFMRDRFDRYSIVSALHALLQSLLFVGLAWALGGRGLLIAFPASAFLLAAGFTLDLRRLGLFEWRWFLPRWNRGMAAFLAGHGSALLLTGVGGGFLVLFVRSLLVSRAGLSENGILQVAIAFSSYGGSVVTNFLWAKVHPSCSAQLTATEEGEMSFAMFIAFVVATLTWAAAPLSVPLVYSHDFHGAVSLVGLQSAGDVLYFAFFTLSVACLARGGVRLFVLCWAAYYLPYLAAMLPGIELTAQKIVWMHAAGSLIALCAQTLAISFGSLALAGTAFRALGFALPLSAMLGAAVLAGPASVAIRLLLTAVLLAVGYGIWYLAYRATARATAKIFLSRIRGFWASTPRSHQ